jgi:O-antigen/teichoic acid export membrane protein
VSGLGARVATGVAWLTAGRLAAAVLQIVAFAIIAGDLGPAGMGVFTLVLGVVGILQIATDFGFQGVVTREVAQDRGREASLIPNLLYIRAFGGVLAYVVVVCIALVVLPADQRSPALVAGGVLLVSALEALATGLQVRVRTGPAALGSLLGAVTFLVATLMLAHADAGVTSYLAAKVATTLVAVGLPAAVGPQTGACAGGRCPASGSNSGEWRCRSGWPSP